nr:hypothetical transcript [Hymenolepis microstoma]
MIDLPSRGAPWATYTHTAKRSINTQLTSNYPDPTVCHIRPLPQYSPYLFLYLCVCLSRTSVNHSSVPLPYRLFVTLTFFLLCEARSQLKG